MTSDLLRQFERLEEDRARLLGRIEELDNRQLNRKPGENQWSVIQVFCHLIKAEELSLDYIRKKTQGRSNLRPAGLTGAWRSAALTMFLRSPLRFKAPAAAAELPAEQDLATTVGEWNRVRAEWKAMLGSLPPEIRDRAIYRHPVAGRMSLSQALRFLREHLRHHARQVERILARVG